MPTQRQIREATIQFLYSADLEGGADTNHFREVFWDFLTETDRYQLNVATFRTIQHLAMGRQDRLSEFITRAELAKAHLSAFPQAEFLNQSINRMLASESSWSLAFAELSKIPKTGDESVQTDLLAQGLDRLFTIDRDLAFLREQFLKETADFPSMSANLEPTAGTIRRLQRISDRIRMIEDPENFPEQSDLTKIRTSKSEIKALKDRADSLINSVLKHKFRIDEELSGVVENYVPERINPVDRAILRLGVYELLFTDCPPNAAMNEAIELAKRFGTTESARFINGILDKISNHQRL